MRIFPPTLLLLLLCASHVSAQNSARYRFDNFDTRAGVRIAAVETTDALPKATATKVAKISSAKDQPGKRNGLAAGERAGAIVKPVLYAAPHAVFNSANPLVGFTTGDTKIDSYIVDSGKRNGVDPALLYAIMHQESSFKSRALSHKGAAGLMQIMPGTAVRFGVRDRYDPRQSVEGGARYVRFLLDYFGGDVRLALAGYNAGEGAVLRYGRRIPPYRETQDYVRRISLRYELMRDPNARRNAPRATLTEIAAIEPAVAAPVVIPPPSYAREVFAVRLPDGKLRLVNE
jgi:soluble lytic murein transglycosylase-like protein